MERVKMVFLWLSATAVAASGQADELTGVWLQQEDAVTLRFELVADGTFTLGISGSTPLGDFIDADNPLSELELELPQELVFGGGGNGTWAADQTTLTGVLQALEITVNDQTLEVFFTELAQAIASQVADALEIPEEDRAEFEEAFLAELDFSEVFDESSFEDFSGAYTLDGDRLEVVDADGELTVWIREVAQSAVAPSSWGRLKAARDR